MACALRRNLDVEHPACLRQLHLHGTFLQKCLDPRGRVCRCIGQNLQLPVCIAGHNTGCHSHLNALHSVGHRHDNAFHILDDAAADRSRNLLRLSLQGLFSQSRRIRKGDWLCTPGGRDQLLAQHLLVILKILLHDETSHKIPSWVQTGLALQKDCSLFRQLCQCRDSIYSHFP